MEYINNNIRFTYEVIYKKNRNIYLRVKDGRVVITAPFKTSNKDIIRLISKHESFILKRINKNEKVLNEDLLELFGEKFELRLNPSNTNSYSFDENVLSINYKKDYRIVLNTFYGDMIKEKTLEIINNSNLVKEYDLYPKKLIFKNYKSKWGSCKYASREVSLNLKLVYIDEIYLYYVIMHELAHIKYHDHSKKFHDFLEILCPGHIRIRKELKKYTI